MNNDAGMRKLTKEEQENEEEQEENKDRIDVGKRKGY